MMKAWFDLRWHGAATLLALACASLISLPTNASVPGCYAQLGLTPPPAPGARTLHIWVDQTTPLTPAMKQKIVSLVADWGNGGDRIKIARFSANVRGQYTELMFDEASDAQPSEAYLFHLRTRDKKRLLQCLPQREQQFRVGVKTALMQTLQMTDFGLPKTDLFYALTQLSQKLLDPDPVKRKSVLLVSDGLENSTYFSFHHNKKFRPIKAKTALGKLKKHNLIAQWRNAEIYMYGLGYVQEEKSYVTPALLESLKSFWRQYLTTGQGHVVQLGTPELLLREL